MTPDRVPFGGFYPRGRSLCSGGSRDFPSIGLRLSPPDARDHPIPPVSDALQARPARRQGRHGVQPSEAFPCPHVAGGRPVCADPDREILRLSLTTRAGPASPARLPVYPRRDEEIVGMRHEDGDFAGKRGRGDRLGVRGAVSARSGDTSSFFPAVIYLRKLPLVHPMPLIPLYAGPFIPGLTGYPAAGCPSHGDTGLHRTP